MNRELCIKVGTRNNSNNVEVNVPLLKSIENCKQLNSNTYISKKQMQEEY